MILTCSHGPGPDILSTLNKGVNPEERVLSLQHPLGSSDQRVGDMDGDGVRQRGGGTLESRTQWGWRVGKLCSQERSVARDRMETEELGTQDYTWGTQHEAVQECLHSRSLLLAKEVPRTSGYHRG